MKLVSIVILNWRSYPDVMEAAASALAQRGVEIELIIVDNGSDDGSLAHLRRAYPAATFVELGYNSGFATGMNAGLNAASGAYVLLQNADLVLDQDYCRLAVEAMAEDGRIGVVGGLVKRLVRGVKTDALDAQGYSLSRLFRARLLDHRHEGDTLGVSGSCPVLHAGVARDLAARVGYVLDPWYFTYFEDIDLMLRVNLMGWKVRYEPRMNAWHVRSGSTAIGSRFYEKPLPTLRHHMKNRLATIVKAAPGWVLRQWFLPLLLTECAIPLYLLLRRPSGLSAWASAWFALFGETPRLIRDRRRILGTASAEAHARLRILLSPRFLEPLRSQTTSFASSR